MPGIGFMIHRSREQLVGAVLLAIVELSYQMETKRQGRRGLDSWERAQRRPGPPDSGFFREGWPMQGPLSCSLRLVMGPTGRHWVVWRESGGCCGREGRCMRELIYGVCLRQEEVWFSLSENHFTKPNYHFHIGININVCTKRRPVSLTQSTTEHQYNQLGEFHSRTLVPVASHRQTSLSQ
ncbi:hypothetical protein DL98DRAFT_157535 [Cadophora sp. DSE1049]|nr:hypothetical protein DL98DRAFT_157535 [Cadophora sp. DSE1049]